MVSDKLLATFSNLRYTLGRESVAMNRPQASTSSLADLEDQEFWQSELGQYIQQEADDAVSLDEVRRALAVIPGSLAAAIGQERDER